VECSRNHIEVGTHSDVAEGSLWPSIRAKVNTLTPADSARLAAVCLRSCGVIILSFARATARRNHPFVDFGRGGQIPSENTNSPGSLPADNAEIFEFSSVPVFQASEET